MVTECKVMAKELFTLNSNLYALTRLLTQLDSITKEIQRKDLKKVPTDIPILWSTARCALAEAYLLPNNYMKMNMDWSNEFVCLGHYSTYRVSGMDKMEYQQYIKAGNTEKANQKLFRLFAKAREVIHIFLTR